METMLAVYARACEATAKGDYDSALQDFVWIHDNPLPGVPESEAIRRGFSFFAWANLGHAYPPANELMRKILAEKISSWNEKPGDMALKADIKSMQKVLGFVDSYNDD